MREFSLLQEANVTNVYVVPSHATPLKWFGVLFVHEGIFQGSVFRFRIFVPPEYPDSRETPTLVFDTPDPPFHPLVDQRGRLNTDLMYPEWNPRINKIWQLVLYLKRIFLTIEKDIESLKHVILNRDLDHQNHHPLHDFPGYNLEAVKLYYDDIEGFFSRIRREAADSRERVFEDPMDVDDRNAIIFGPWNPEIHESIRRSMLLTGRAIIEDMRDEKKARQENGHEEAIMLLDTSCYYTKEKRTNK